MPRTVFLARDIAMCSLDPGFGRLHKGTVAKASTLCSGEFGEAWGKGVRGGDVHGRKECRRRAMRACMS